MGGVEGQALARALNMWSLGVQVAVAAIMVTVFFALWLSSRREPVLSWTLAWLLDLVALLEVLAITAGVTRSDHTLEVVVYLVYAAAKIGFAPMMGCFEWVAMSFSWWRLAWTRTAPGNA